jgi:hypothetical protein
VRERKYLGVYRRNNRCKWKEGCSVVIGVLKNEHTLSEKSFLLSCKEMSAENHTTIARIFNEAMQTLWPDGVKFDSVLLLVTDATVREKSSRRTFSELP